MIGVVSSSEQTCEKVVDSSSFSHVSQAPPITVFKLKDDYIKDSNANKINLGVGAYRTGEGKPWPLPVVKAAEKLIVADDSLNKEYREQKKAKKITKNSKFYTL